MRDWKDIWDNPLTSDLSDIQDILVINKQTISTKDAEIAELKERIKILGVSDLRQRIKNSEKDKEIARLREGIEEAIEIGEDTYLTQGYRVKAIIGILSTKSTPDNTKDTLKLSKQGEKNIKKLAKQITPEWSQWYETTHKDLDFFKHVFIQKKDNPNGESYYRIKLSGVRVYEYEYFDSFNNAFFNAVDKCVADKKDIIGHDPHNKIIIISDVK